MTTNPVFNHTHTDDFGDVWPNAICRVDTIEVFEAASSTKFRINDQDQYTTESTDSDVPVKITYSVEFWSKIGLKQAGKQPRQFRHDGDEVFTIEMDSEQMKQVWAQVDDKFQEASVRVAQWHFKNVVGK